VDSATGTPRVKVNIFCAKPGMVIGKGGRERVALQDSLSKEYGKAFVVNVVEVATPPPTHSWSPRTLPVSWRTA
jgi:small subunit ribosomal protein S3